MSEIKGLLENVTIDVLMACEKEMDCAMSIGGIKEIRDYVYRLLPLLEAGADMRYQEWPATMTYGPAKDWDDALIAARRGGPDV